MAVMEDGACCHTTDQTCQIRCNGVRMLADDHVLGRENGCGYVQCHNAGEGEGKEGVEDGGMIRVGW